MTVSQLQRQRTTSLFSDGPLPLPSLGEAPADGGFGQVLNEAISEVNGKALEANAQLTAFVSGEQENVHEVMIALNQSSVAFQLMAEVRNRMLETYQELMRMQV
jgi:flagellar hook-basal body complex protein FliE